MIIGRGGVLRKLPVERCDAQKNRLYFQCINFFSDAENTTGIWACRKPPGITHLIASIITGL